MSETYAATVAAVAPVIWLVGAIEFHQVLKRIEQYVADEEQALEDRLVSLRAEDDDEVAGELAGAANRPSNRKRVLSTLSLYAVWYSLTLALVCVTLSSLVWLGEDGGPGKVSGDSSSLATICFCVLAIGFFVVTMAPAVATMARMRQAAGRNNVRRRAIQQNIAGRRTAQSTRVPVQGDDSVGRNAASPPS
ncbi:hypothetical protein [Streptomyces sp. BE230]|uniref:hypothetical protein n=1 Tax=Streptomyces sp. BE230 TaxID=3002526 RepID=UPI002ED32395|nr:hypothetical protein [Streptomyces sp. BE230]